MSQPFQSSNPTTAQGTSAKIDPTRCRSVPGGDDDPTAATWVAVIGPRDDVMSDEAKKLAARYVSNDGACDRMWGPVPDGPGVTPPGEVPKTQVVGEDEYLKLAAKVNTTKDRNVFVCFHLIRTPR
jgi:hypothetical protein